MSARWPLAIGKAITSEVTLVAVFSIILY